MPRCKDQELESAFHSWKDEDRKGWTVRCNHCGWTRAKHVGRQRQHLEECPSIQIQRAEEAHAGNLERNLTKEEKRRLDLKAARAIFMGSQPLDMMEEKYMVDFQRELTGCKHYVPPTAMELEHKLLETVWQEDHLQVKQMLDLQDYVNVLLERTKDGEADIWLLMNKRAYYWSTCDGRVPEGIFHSLMLSVEGMLTHRIGLHWSRFNSLCIDTSSPTLRIVWEMVSKDPRTRHVFCIPCHSYGLQQLINSILQFPSYWYIYEKARALATSLRHTKHPEQIELMRTYQQQQYGEHRSVLLLSVKDWGTSQGIIQSILQNEDALKSYIKDPCRNLSVDAAAIIQDGHFWATLASLWALISPIVKLQQSSEIGATHLGQVESHWDILRAHINNTADAQLLPALLNLVDAHRKASTVPLYTIAHNLDPKNQPLHSSPTTVENNAMIEFVCRYGDKCGTARSQYTRFRIGSAEFSRQNRTYDLVDKALWFWAEMMMFARELASIALRVFNTPVTSMPSQRAFLGREFSYPAWKHRIGEEKANKLMFIYFNRRVLQNSSPKSAWEMTEKMLVERENRLLGYWPDERHGWRSATKEAEENEERKRDSEQSIDNEDVPLPPRPRATSLPSGSSAPVTPPTPTSQGPGNLDSACENEFVELDKTVAPVPVAELEDQKMVDVSFGE